MALTPPDHHVLSLRIGPLLIGALLLHSAMLGAGQAAVTSAMTGDGSMGTAVTQTRNTYTISGGTITGSNLFHSFGRFSVGTGDQAIFTGPPAIANIVSRVTGGEASVIDGLLRSDIAGANLYLLNPSGVLFGPDARLEVSGSFHVSTADFLRFADGAKFSAHSGQESVLTVASPHAFGFLGNNPAAITIRGSTLQVPDGKAISVVGGDIEILGNPVLPPFSIPTLGASGGRIRLVSVASPGEAMFSPLELAPDLQVHSFARLGRLTLSEGAFIDASGNGGGAVLVRGGHLLVDRSNVFADNLGRVDGVGLGLDIGIRAESVIRNGSFLTTDSLGAGRARDLQLTAGSAHIDGSVIGSRPNASGDGGNISVNVGSLMLTGGAQLDSGTRGSGRGGTLTVAATEAIAISGRNQNGNLSGLFSNTFGSGDAGRLFVSTPLLTMDEGWIQAAADTGSSGNAGDIEVRVGRLSLTGGAQLTSSTFGPGRGGTLTVAATDAISISGRGGVAPQTGLFSLTDGSGDAGRLFVSAPTVDIAGGRILGRTLGGGHAGDIELRVGRLTLTEGGQIFNGIGTVVSGEVIGQVDGLGRGGNLTVTATDSIFIAGHDQLGLPSGLFSGAQIGRGDAGNLFISTPTLTMLDSGLIAADTFSTSSGNAGNIEVRVGRLTMSEGAQISTSSVGVGRGGNITVTATEQIELSKGGTISARSSGQGEAGNIVIRAGQLFRSRNGAVTTEAETAGGGTIALRAGRLVQLQDSAVTTSVQGGGADAGNLTLEAPFVVADGSAIVANAFGGRGGNILINAGVFLADPASLVSASSTLGIPGTVDIQAPVTSLSGTLAPLPQAFVNVAALLPARCAARASAGLYSSLVVGGRGGLPPEPGGLLSSPLIPDPQLGVALPGRGESRRHQSVSGGSLLHSADKAFPRLQHGLSRESTPPAVAWSCSR